MKSSERAVNPGFFESMECAECQNTEDLKKNRYNDTIMCTVCLNVIAAELALENEDDYRDSTYAEIIMERNL